MYRDLQAGRRTEVEHVFGDLISRARSLGVATPLLDAATLTMRVHDARLGMPPG
jgi:2-dehydropantoate 2-reductase